ncbi:MAG: ABC transporter ATP-binding protein [Rhodocyclaceae bacterium]|nr:ABC transporter ATP-binding protein [Rhodocyclaceae bacterium]
MSLLVLDHVSHAYGDHPVVADLTLSLGEGEIGCLLGASGCGKTTVLRLIAGFETPGDGRILLRDEVVAAPGRNVPPEKRRIGMVFQDYALFPHLSVAGNIGFGLDKKSAAAGRPDRPSSAVGRVEELLALVGLSGQGGKFPHELSGGQQQRVALARALAPRPHLLLLDEPFSNLDVELRERLSLEVRDILKATGTAAILVTHDQHEAFAVADKVGVMHAGRIEQWDSPYDLYHRPATRRVADFVGQGAFLAGTVSASGQLDTELGHLHGTLATECDGGSCALLATGTRVDVLLRPDDVIHDDSALQQAEIVAKAFRGAEFLYTLQLASGATVLSLVPSHHNHAIGERIGIRLDVDHVVAFGHDPVAAA